MVRIDAFRRRHRGPVNDFLFGLTIALSVGPVALLGVAVVQTRPPACR
ncbi:hypothetical protein EMIT0158MI4_140166 [Burkholderia ambifaria]